MDDWQVGEVRFPRRYQPPPWDGRGVRFDYLKASLFDDTGSALNTATAATDQDGWSLQSLYFGNGAVLSDLKQPLTLSERASEATGRYVYEVKFQPGYTVNVDSLNNGQGIDYHGRARYLVFLGRIVALHPDEDLKIVGRTTLKVLKYNPHHDELGRFASGDGEGGTTISSDIPGQVEGGGTGSLFPDPNAPPKSILDVKPPNYPLPPGYLITPNADEDGNHGGFNVYANNKLLATIEDKDAAQQFAVEHAAAALPKAGDKSGYQITPNGPTNYVVTYQGKSGPVFHVGEFGDLATANNYVDSLTTPLPKKDESGGNLPKGVLVGLPDGLPVGYTVVPNHDTQDFTVWYGSKPVGQFDQKISAVEYAHEHYATATPDTSKPKAVLSATDTLNEATDFHLTADQLPNGFQVNPSLHGSGFDVVDENGIAYTHGNDAKDAVTNYFNTHTTAALPQGYTYVQATYTNTILDPQGNAVWIADNNGNQSNSQIVENFLNSPTAPSVFTNNSGVAVQTKPLSDLAVGPAALSTAAQTLGTFHLSSYNLPAGWTVAQNQTGSFTVSSPDGSTKYYGDNETEAVNTYFDAHPQDAMPEGFTFTGNSVLDDKGNVVFAGQSYMKPSETIYNYLNSDKAPSQFQIGAGTHVQDAGKPQPTSSLYTQPFVPGEEHLPAGLKVVAGNYAVPFKVVGEDGVSLATGETKEGALKDYFTYHANSMLPGDYHVAFDTLNDAPIITDPFGTEVYSGKPGESSYNAAINYLTANPALAPKAVGGDDLHDAYTLLPKGQAILSGGHGEFKIYDNDGKVVHTGVVGATATETVKEYLNVSSGVPSAAPVVHAPGPTEADLPAGVHLVNVTPSYVGGDEFKIYDEKGHSTGGQTRDQALNNYFTSNPNKLLPTGYHVDDNQPLTHIIGPNGLEVYAGGADIVQTIQDFKAKGADTASLADIGDTYFGPGRPGLEPLSEAGLPPGFNVSHERGRGGESTFAGTGEVSPPSQHQVTADEKQTIYSYTGAGNSAINRFLREDERPDSPSDVTRRIADLDRVFADTSTAKAMTLYRGISENAQAKLDYAIAHSDGHFVDKGFLSTSSSESVAGNWKSGSYVTIDVPAGSKFLDTEHPKMLTSHPGESEWIGARNQHFVVTKQEKSHYGYGNRTHYFVKLINAGKTQPKDTRQLDLPFVDVGPVNKQEEPYDPNEKYIWQENDIVPIHPEDIANYYRKYNDAHDALGRFAETGSTGSSSETSSGPVPTISAEHEAAIGRYTGKNSSDINQYLRFGTQRGDPAEVSGDIKALDDVLDQNRTTAPTTVWRSIDRNMVKALGKAIDKGQGVIVDKGFTSTSRKQRFASIRDVGYVSIELPTGSPAMDVKPWSRKPEEDETLIGRNQTYHASRDPSDPRHFILKLVPNVGKAGVRLYKVRVRKDDKFTWSPSDVVFLAIKYNENHDERGRFSSASGGGAQPFDYVIPPEVHAEDMRRADLHVKELARQYNFDPNKVSVVSEARQFELNGKKYDYAGAAYSSGPKAGTIEIWPDKVMPSDMAKIMAHEVMHQHFNNFLDEYDKEIKSAADESSATGWTKDSPMRASGSINEAFKDKYPILYAADEGNERGGGIGGLMNTMKLAETDGVTDYSKEYWKGWNDGTVDSRSAIHETLAELAYLGGGPRATPAPKLPEGYDYKAGETPEGGGKGGWYVIKPNDQGYRFSVGWGETKYDAARNSYIIGEDGKTKDLFPELKDKPKTPFAPFVQSKVGTKFPDRRWRKLYDLVNATWDRTHPK